MIEIIKRYAIEIVSLICAIVFLVLGGLFIHGSNGKLFQEPETLAIEKNGDSMQKLHGDVANVIHAFADELLAERVRLRSIRKLCKDSAEILLYVSAFQFGVTIISLFRKRRRRKEPINKL